VLTVMCISAEPCEELLPDCSISVIETGSEKIQVERVCRTHDNLLPDKIYNMLHMSVTATQSQLWVRRLNVICYQWWSLLSAMHEQQT